MQFAMTDVMAEATRLMGRSGIELLGGEPWGSGMSFLSGVRGYVGALGSRTDWRAVREDLVALSAEGRAGGEIQDPEGKVVRSERQQIDTIVATRWAQTDLDAAAAWYVQELDWEGFAQSDADRTAAILNSLGARDFDRTADWLAARRGTGEWNDEVVVLVLRHLSGMRPDPVLEEVVAMPVSAEARDRIVEAFVTPRERKGRFVLRHPPEDLRRMVEAANLPAERRAHWLATIESATWEES